LQEEKQMVNLVVLKNIGRGHIKQRLFGIKNRSAMRYPIQCDIS